MNIFNFSAEEAAAGQSLASSKPAWSTHQILEKTCLKKKGGKGD